MLVQSALRSEEDFHKKMGISLLNERQALKPNSNITKRIVSRFAAAHQD